MNCFAYHENKVRGTFDFPIELHHVSSRHPRYAMPFHWHMELEFIRILQGSLELSLDGKFLCLQEGDVALVNSGIIHGGIPHECVYQCLVFDFQHFVQTGPMLRSSSMTVMTQAVLFDTLYPAGSELSLLMGRVFEAAEKQSTGYEWTVTGLLYEWMGEVLRLKKYGADQTDRKLAKKVLQIKKTLQRIRLDYAATLTLEDLAMEAGLSPKYFCRMFRQVTGRTPVDYLNYYRIECAAEQLLTTCEPVTDIALSCGFNDLSYFVKQFRRYKGCSASIYRRQAQVQDEL